MIDPNQLLQQYQQSQHSQQAQQAQPPAPSGIGGFVQNAGSDLGSLVKGILNLPGVALGAITNPGSIPDVGKNVVSGVANEYGGLVSDPGHHIYEHPISSLLDVLPFLKPLQAISGLGKAGEAGKAAEIAGEAGNAEKLGAVTNRASITELPGASATANTNPVLEQVLGGRAPAAEPIAAPVKAPAPPPELTPTQQKIVRTVDQLNPSSKNLISKNALNGRSVSSAQAALEHDLYSTTGANDMITATKQAMDQNGVKIQDSLASSNINTDTVTVRNQVKAALKDNGVPDNLQKKVLDTVMPSENQKLDGPAYWQRTRDVERAGKLYTGVATSTPIKNAYDIAAKTMRGEIRDLSKETQPFMDRYAALADHMDRLPDNPTGPGIPDITSIPKAAAAFGKNATTLGLQKAFNAAANSGEAATVKGGLLNKVLNPISKDSLGAAGQKAGAGLKGIPGVTSKLATSQINQLLRNYPVAQDQSTQNLPPIADNAQAPQVASPAQQQPQSNPYPIENYIQDATRDPKNAAFYKQVYDAYQAQDATRLKTQQTYQNSPEYKNAQAGSKAKSQVQTVLDQFNAVPQGQTGIVGGLQSQVPLLGQAIAPQATEYENQRAGIAPILKEITGAGSGSGVRVTQAEINNWVKLLPSVHKTPEQNKIDIQQLNNRLQASVGVGLDPQYLQ